MDLARVLRAINCRGHKLRGNHMSSLILHCDSVKNRNAIQRGEWGEEWWRVDVEERTGGGFKHLAFNEDPIRQERERGLYPSRPRLLAKHG